MRLYTVVLVLLFRLIMMPTYLQSYLNMAYHKLEELKQEAGKISNVELKKSVVRVFYYLCVVSRIAESRIDMKVEPRLLIQSFRSNF